MNINIEQYLPWVIRVAKPFARSAKVAVMDSEFFADGCLGLAKAVENFEPERGLKFLTFAHHYVLGEILDGIKRRQTVKNGYSGELIRISASEASEDLAIDRSESVQTQAQRREEAEALHLAIAQLSADLRQVVQMRLQGLTLKEIGDLIGVSKQRVEVIEKHAHVSLRQTMLASNN